VGTADGDLSPIDVVTLLVDAQRAASQAVGVLCWLQFFGLGPSSPRAMAGPFERPITSHE